jgi:hypothetical protein
LLKQPDKHKVTNLEVGVKSYWLYTNHPFDNRKRWEVFETYGFEKDFEGRANGGEFPQFPVTAPQRTRSSAWMISGPPGARTRLT